MIDFPLAPPRDSVQRKSTKDIILDTAERLFAQQGFEAASLRIITSAAGVNLAAVNYHFRSKDALIAAVVGRRMGPLNERRLHFLEEAEAAGNGIPDLKLLVRAFLVPMIEANRESPQVFMARLYIDSNEFAERIFDKYIAPVVKRFVASLQRALPNVPQDQLYWRLHFMAGSLLHTIGAGHFLTRVSEGQCDPSDTDEVLRNAEAFLSFGLGAPATSNAGSVTAA